MVMGNYSSVQDLIFSLNARKVVLIIQLVIVLNDFLLSNLVLGLGLAGGKSRRMSLNPLILHKSQYIIQLILAPAMVFYLVLI